MTSSESTPLVWIDHWVEARECLVVPAEDLETGVAISFLEGRHCDDKLRALERVVPVTDDPLVKSWRLAIARLRHTTFPSAVQRSVEIRIVDNGARLLTALQGRPLAPMPRGPALARAHQRDFVPRPWVTKLGSRFYGVESDSFKAAVNLESLDDYRIAYEIAVTRPDGTWQYFKPLGSLRETRLYDSPPSIEQLVRREDQYYLDRVGPDGSRTSTLLDVPARPGPVCHHNGVIWRYDDGELHRSVAGADAVMWPVGVGLHMDRRLRCAAGRAIVDAPDHVLRCSDRGCRKEFMSPVPLLKGHASLLASGRWVYGVTLEHVAAIWIEGQLPRYVRLTDDISWDRIFDGVADLEIDGRVLPLAFSKYLHAWYY